MKCLSRYESSATIFKFGITLIDLIFDSEFDKYRYDVTVTSKVITETVIRPNLIRIV